MSERVTGGPCNPSGQLGTVALSCQVSLEIVIVGNFDEKSFARCAIFTATCRATDL
jgi:hypothetical protein